MKTVLAARLKQAPKSSREKVEANRHIGPPPSSNPSVFSPLPQASKQPHVEECHKEGNHTESTPAAVQPSALLYVPATRFLCPTRSRSSLTIHRTVLFQRTAAPPIASCSCCYSTAALPFLNPRAYQANSVPGPSRNGGVVVPPGEHTVEHALAEAVETLNTPEQLRLFFVHLLVNDYVASPIKLWNAFQDALARDLILAHGNANIGMNKALEELDRALGEHGRSLAYYKLPEPTFHSREVAVEQERWEPEINTLARRSANAVSRLNREQHEIYTEVMDAVANQRPLCAFVDGKAGRGKTFLVNTICNKLRSEGHIVLPTATSAFAAQLYPGGKTTHSMFKVSLDCSPCDVWSLTGRLDPDR